MPRPNKINAAAFFVGTQAASSTNDKTLNPELLGNFSQKASLLSAEMPGQQMITKKIRPTRMLDKTGTLFSEAIKNSLDCKLL